MNRDTFLDSEWKKYPAAPDGALSVADFLSSDLLDIWVAGRLGQDVQWLEWQGQKLDLTAGLQSEDIELQGMQSIDGSFLECGDLVAVRIIKDEIQSSGFSYSQFVLLAPVRGPRIEQKASAETLKKWSEFLSSVRRFFNQRQFLEIQTPLIVDSPGTEPSLDHVSVQVPNKSGFDQKFLPTSPEFHLKKAWSLDLGDVFEIQRCFRAKESSPHHRTEFTMLEWYESFADPSKVIKTMVDLIEFLSSSLAVPFDPTAIEVYSWKELFEEVLDFDLKVDTESHKLVEILDREGIHYSENDSWTDLFHRILIEKIEPFIYSKNHPVFVTKFPPVMRAFSRLTSDGWGDRFEMYWGNLELCNGFNEINDPDEQLQCFVRDIEEKQVLGKDIVPLDHELLQALQSGMNPGTGVALGLDRLFMKMTGIETIEKTRLF